MCRCVIRVSVDGGLRFPKERWPEDPVFIQFVKRDMQEYGDRKQKIVFIGLN